MEGEREEVNYEDAVEASPGDVSGAHDSGLFVFSGSPDLRIYGLAHVEPRHVTSRCDLSSQWIREYVGRAWCVLSETITTAWFVFVDSSACSSPGQLAACSSPRLNPRPAKER